MAKTAILCGEVQTSGTVRTLPVNLPERVRLSWWQAIRQRRRYVTAWHTEQRPVEEAVAMSWGVPVDVTERIVPEGPHRGHVHLIVTERA